MSKMISAKNLKVGYEEKIIIDYVKRLHKRWEDEENESN